MVSIVMMRVVVVMNLVSRVIMSMVVVIIVIIMLLMIMMVVIETIVIIMIMIGKRGYDDNCGDESGEYSDDGVSDLVISHGFGMEALLPIIQSSS